MFGLEHGSYGTRKSSLYTALVRFTFRSLVVLGALCVNGFASEALAQDDAGCPTVTEPRGPVEIFPASGATAVALDAPIRVRYSAGFFASNPDAPSSLISVTNSDTGQSVPGTVTVLGDTLVFRPDGGFPPSSLFDGVARGIDVDVSLSFLTGAATDITPPSAPAFQEIVADEVAATCETVAGYRIDVSFTPSTDVDGARGDIEYLLFMTRAPRLAVPELVARTRNFAGDSITMSFVLESERATGAICLALNAVDGVGHVVSSSENCSDPIQGNFFDSLCSASIARPSSPSLYAAIPLIAALVITMRRRRAKRVR